MRHLFTMLTCLLTIVLFAAPANAQEEGDYRTQDSGDWSDAQIWQRFNGSSWVAIGTPPEGSETITVVATEERTDSVFVDAATTITGRLIHQGIVATEGDLSVGDGGVYQYDRDEGDLPITNWEEGSTFLITGVTATAPDNRNQDYYNLTFDTPGLLANLNMDLNDATIGGDVRVLNTGEFGSRWYLTSVTANDTAIVTIEGDVIVEDGNFSVQGTSNVNTTFIVHHYGNINVTSGNFSISRGSQGNGTTTWHIYEGDFSIDNANTQSSTATPRGARFVFEAEGMQTLSIGENVPVNEGDPYALPIEVSSGTTLDMGMSRIGGTGFFVVNEGGELATARPGGVAEIFNEVADVELQDNSSYVFNGTEAQVTSDAMPTTVENLTINNPEGVALSQETTITGVLRLQAGVFDNSISFTLGPDGSISEEGGSLSEPVAREGDDELPQTFYVEQNFPNPFNPSTVIRYGLPADAEVTLTVYNTLGQKVWTSSEGHKPAGVHEFTFDAGDLSSGMYLYRIDAGDFAATKQMILVE